MKYMGLFYHLICYDRVRRRGGGFLKYYSKHDLFHASILETLVNEVVLHVFLAIIDGSEE